MRRLLPAALALAGLAAGGPAAAHAFLNAASPNAGARLAQAPAEVRLTFSEPLEPAFSSISVAGPPGFGGAGPATLGQNRRTLAARLKGPTPAGAYRVHWRVLSVDSHTTQGDFRFEVGR